MTAHEDHERYTPRSAHFLAAEVGSPPAYAFVATPRRCWSCGVPIDLDDKYTCSPACRQKLYRQRRKIRPVIRIVAAILAGRPAGQPSRSGGSDLGERQAIAEALAVAQVRYLLGGEMGAPELEPADLKPWKVALLQEVVRIRHAPRPADPPGFYRLVEAELRSARSRVAAEMKAAMLPGSRR
ncbi:MAG: DUF2116 family Zn-ribbon domain-containing protein [Myxococcota bacterium]